MVGAAGFCNRFVWVNADSCTPIPKRPARFLMPVAKLYRIANPAAKYGLRVGAGAAMRRGQVPGLWAGWAAGLPVILAATLAAAAVWAAPATHQGVASCAGSTCHGRPAPSGITVRQNELITWQGPGDAGAHSRAWKVLAQPRAQAIADRLGIGPATRAKECL